MKIALATHTLRGYPPRLRQKPELQVSRSVFSWARKHGFDGIEVAAWWLDYYTADIEDMLRLKDEMGEYGLELAGFNCLRKCVTHPAVAEANKRDLRRTIEVAKVVKPKFVNISLSLEGSAVGVPEDRIRGLPVSPGSGRDASDEDFREAARFLSELADDAGEAGVGIAIELHHCSLTDTSQNLLRILDLADNPNLSANPDLVNVQWAYDSPQEEWYDSVRRLVGRVKFWHLKNVQAIRVPELHHAFFVHASLGEGDVDYRWAIGQLVAGGFDGYFSIESGGRGDPLGFAAKGKAYLDDLLAELRDGIGPVQ